MKVKIVTIADRGVANKERLHLSVLADTNTSYYVVFQSFLIGPNQIRALPAFAYWFTASPLQAGDAVILYSCAGVNSKEQRLDGRTNHFYFCGLPKTVWHDPSSTAVVLEINGWVSGG